MAISMGGEKGAPMAEINITPLTDVFLVLLIIFMVTTTMLAQQNIKLPAMETAKPQPEQSVVVGYSKEGIISVNDVMNIAEPNLVDELTRRLTTKEEKDKIVVLRMDREVSVGKGVELMYYASLAGAKDLAVGTMPKRKSR